MHLSLYTFPLSLENKLIEASAIIWLTGCVDWMQHFCPGLVGFSPEDPISSFFLSHVLIQLLREASFKVRQ